MSQHELNVLEAIEIAKDAEQKAAAFYSDAAQKLAHPIGRKLLEELAEFERHHYSKLTELENSLRKKGAFIDYEGRDLQVRVPGRSEITTDANPKTAMEVITLAIDAEQKAEKRYEALAEQVTDSAAHAMFRRLTEEEHGHFRVLGDAYWNLNNRGIWAWEK